MLAPPPLSPILPGYTPWLPSVRLFLMPPPSGSQGVGQATACHNMPHLTTPFKVIVPCHNIPQNATTYHKTPQCHNTPHRGPPPLSGCATCLSPHHTTPCPPPPSLRVRSMFINILSSIFTSAPLTELVIGMVSRQAGVNDGPH